jgi:hypothetical protein
VKRSEVHEAPGGDNLTTHYSTLIMSLTQCDSDANKKNVKIRNIVGSFSRQVAEKYRAIIVYRRNIRVVMPVPNALAVGLCFLFISPTIHSLFLLNKGRFRPKNATSNHNQSWVTLREMFSSLL